MNTSNLENLKSLSKAMDHDTERLIEKEAEVDKLRAALAERAARFAKLAHSVRTDISRPQATTPLPKVATQVAPLKQAKRKGKGKKVKGVIRYRDPENPKHAWTGIGTTPNWIKQSGKGKEAFLVSGSAA